MYKNSTPIYRNTYNSYDPELKKIVAQTKNIHLATSKGVPRMTAVYWATKSKNIPKEISCAESLLNEEINNLNRKLIVERAKVQFISSVASYLSLVKNSKKKISKSIKKFIVDKIELYKKYCSIAELLSLVGISSSRLAKWRSALRRCDNTKRFECGARKLNQLTGDEIIKIVTMAASKKYRHFSLSALWKYALKNSLVICSIDTWFKYLNMYEIKRERWFKKKKQYGVGIRADRPNQILHLDLTELELEGGEKVYLQAIVDNYSRYIIDWSVSENKLAENTVKLLKSSKAKIEEESNVNVYMDKGTENKNSKVEQVFSGSNMIRIFAKSDVRYSNSIVEAFFRSIKNNYLYSKKIKTFHDFKRAVKFYIKEHNNRMPHGAFKFETPQEIYYDLWTNEKSANLKELKKHAIMKRKEINENYIKCNNCMA